MIIDILLAQVLGRGGLETVLVHVSKKLRERGHRVRFVFYHPSLIVEWMQELGEVYICSNLQEKTDTEQGYSHEAFAKSYRMLINHHGFPDVVLGTFRPLFTIVARLAFQDLPRREHPPVLSWIHGPPEAYQANAAHFVQADAHLAISYVVGQKINSYHPTAPVFFVGNPIYRLPDPQEGHTIPRSAYLRVIYIGQIDSAVKGIPVLLEACSKLHGQWRLDLYGEGGERAALTERCHALAIAEQVHWHGWHSDVWSQISEASLLILPSNSEGFGMVLTEALQRGIPVVATQTDGAKEVVIDDYNGWTFPIGENEALAVILQEIVDGKRILPTAEQCRLSVQIYQSEQVMENFEHALHTMIAYKKQVRHYEAVDLQTYEEKLEARVSAQIPQILSHYNEKQWERVIEEGEALYVQMPAFSELAFLLGHTHLKLQHYNRAHFYYKQVLMTASLVAYRQFAQTNIKTLRMVNLESSQTQSNVQEQAVKTAGKQAAQQQPSS